MKFFIEDNRIHFIRPEKKCGNLRRARNRIGEDTIQKCKCNWHNQSIKNREHQNSKTN